MKILLAVDDSKFSSAATQALSAQIPDRNSEVLVLEVVEPLYFSAPPEMAPNYAPEMALRQKDEIKHANETVIRNAEALRRAGFTKVNSKVMEGETRSSILNTAADWRPDLIVLGSHGRKGIQRFLLGSVAEFVARHAPCSVLVVRSAA
ncbi:MAG TPA: universal stress protein [Candidatus Angelobacter sp.]|nr:universal stress protein [Candidatus Angelobacter sp.]